MEPATESRRRLASVSSAERVPKAAGACGKQEARPSGLTASAEPSPFQCRLMPPTADPLVPIRQSTRSGHRLRAAWPGVGRGGAVKGEPWPLVAAPLRAQPVRKSRLTLALGPQRVLPPRAGVPREGPLRGPLAPPLHGFGSPPPPSPPCQHRRWAGEDGAGCGSLSHHGGTQAAERSGRLCLKCPFRKEVRGEGRSPRSPPPPTPPPTPVLTGQMGPESSAQGRPRPGRENRRE